MQLTAKISKNYKTLEGLVYDVDVKRVLVPSIDHIRAACAHDSDGMFGRKSNNW